MSECASKWCAADQQPTFSSLCAVSELWQSVDQPSSESIINGNPIGSTHSCRSMRRAVAPVRLDQISYITVDVYYDFFERLHNHKRRTKRQKKSREKTSKKNGQIPVKNANACGSASDIDGLATAATTPMSYIFDRNIKIINSTVELIDGRHDNESMVNGGDRIAFSDIPFVNASKCVNYVITFG